MSRFVRPLGSAGIAVQHGSARNTGVLSAYQSICFQYRRAGVSPPPRKVRFESPARTKFLRANKKPQKMWMSKSNEVMGLLDALSARSM